MVKKIDQIIEEVKTADMLAKVTEIDTIHRELKGALFDLKILRNLICPPEWAR